MRYSEKPGKTYFRILLIGLALFLLCLFIWLHNANPLQPSYEEDILESWGKIAGHYRIE